MPSPAPTKAPVHPAQPGQVASDGQRSEQAQVGSKLVPADSTTARLHAAGFGHRAPARQGKFGSTGRDVYRLDTGEVVLESASAKSANEFLAKVEAELAAKEPSA